MAVCFCVLAGAFPGEEVFAVHFVENRAIQSQGEKMAEPDLIENTERAFLALLQAALHNGTAELPDQVDWPGLFQLANLHHILPLILEAAWRSGAPEEHLTQARLAAMPIVMSQVRRTASFLALYRQLAAQGLQPLVLKGLVCRSLYPNPDNRPSSDEDLLIRPASFPAVHEALLRCGLHCEGEDTVAEAHEKVYTGPDLCLELHLSPFPTDSIAYGDLNAFFEGAHERAITLEIGGTLVRTLSATDHLLYLICHAYKHFLHSGVGIRQVCDIMLFAERCCPEIGWDRVRNSCDQVRIERFAAAMFAIGTRHLGFTAPTAFCDIQTDEGPMLRDMFSGGVYGAADENRQHSATITLNAVTRQRQGKKSSGVLGSLFLPLNSMKRKFPYLKKYPWLLPAAWVQRMGRYLLYRGKSIDPAVSIRIGNERIALLRTYGIIE